MPHPFATAATLALVVVLSQAGCSRPTATDEVSEGGSGGDRDFPVTVNTAFGEVTIEEEPQRVVALGWGDAETALALGVQPVGASDWLAFGGDGVGPWAEGVYDESPELIGTLEPELEKVAALRPDLILDVNSSGEQQRYDALAQIAPVVGVPEGAELYATSWREQVSLVSVALGRADQGEDLIRQVEDRIDQTAAQYPEFGRSTIAVAARTGEGWGAYVSSDGRVQFAEAMGFTNSPAIQEQAGADFSIDVSEERLDLLDADLTVVIPIGVDSSEITEDPLFQRVPSVEDGRVVVFTDRQEDVRLAFSTNTTLSLAYALERVPPMFAHALAAGR